MYCTSSHILSEMSFCDSLGLRFYYDRNLTQETISSQPFWLLECTLWIPTLCILGLWFWFIQLSSKAFALQPLCFVHLLDSSVGFKAHRQAAMPPSFLHLLLLGSLYFWPLFCPCISLPVFTLPRRSSHWNPNTPEYSPEEQWFLLWSCIHRGAKNSTHFFPLKAQPFPTPLEAPLYPDLHCSFWLNLPMSIWCQATH